jgi:hypothetical protein
MKYLMKITTAIAMMAFAVAAVNADDKDQKKKDNGTVDRIRQPDPPKESTGTVKSPTLKPSDGHKSPPKFKEVPPPKTDKK